MTTVPDVSVRRETRTRRPSGSRGLTGLLFVSPAIALFVVFIGGPFVFAVVLSLFSWDLLGAPRFVGADNFATLFGDPLLGKVLVNTFLFAIASVVTHVVGALLLALAVNRAMNKVLSYFVRAAFFFPFLISWSAVALLFKYVLDPTFGPVGYYLGAIGLPSPDWFTDTDWALPAIIGVDWWHTIGFTFVIMLAGLQTVPEDLADAARTDGAGRWQVFWNVTIPLMSPTLFFATIITFIGAFQIFDPMQIITAGGPDNATKSIVMYLYEQGFSSFQIGYASAVAVLVFVVIMIVTLVQFVASRRWVFEQ